MQHKHLIKELSEEAIHVLVTNTRNTRNTRNTSVTSTSNTNTSNIQELSNTDLYSLTSSTV